MQVFKTFMKIVRANSVSAIIYAVVFMVLAIAMTNSSSEIESYEDKQMCIGIIDNDDTPESRELAEFFSKTNKRIELDNSIDDILDAVYYTRADYVLIIKEGFAQKLADGNINDLFENYKLPSSYNGEFFDSKIENYIDSAKAFIAAGKTPSEALSAAGEAVSTKVDAQILSFENTGSADYSKQFSVYYQYLVYIFISILVSTLCPVLLVMNKKEIKNRTICSSMTASSYSLQTALGAGVFVLGIWLLFTAAGFMISGFAINRKVLIAMLNSFLFILSAAGITLIISSFDIGREAITLVTNVVGLGMSFLCGVFVPQEILSQGVLSAGKLLPGYWYVKANNMLAGTNGEVFDLSEIFKCMMIEVLFAAALFAAAMLLLRSRRRDNV